MTKDNLPLLEQLIPMSNLPTLFKDAMWVTRELGFEFIWIDSLCIMQDSKSDWESESKRMGEIYKNAELNIAASRCRDGTQSLFGDRQALPLQLYRLLFDWTLHDANSQSTAELKGYYVHVFALDYSRKVMNSSLNSRGWVAQERVLSPCVLSYGEDQVWWECKELLASETFPSGFPAEKAKLDTQSIRELNEYGYDCPSVHSFWNQFITRYSGNSLTFPEDRFPAVAGIARILQGLLKDNLVAGHWEGELRSSLTWQRTSNSDAVRVSRVQQCPTWSWASLFSPVYIPPDPGFCRRPVTGIEIQVIWRIPGVVSDLQLASFDKSAVTGLEITAPLKDMSPKSETSTPCPVLHLNRDYLSRGKVQYLDGELVGEEDRRFAEPTHFLPLCLDECWSIFMLVPDDKITISVAGLALVGLTQDESAGRFIRVGAYSVFFRSREEWTTFWGPLSSGEKFPDELEFEQGAFESLTLL